MLAPDSSSLVTSKNQIIQKSLRHDSLDNDLMKKSFSGMNESKICEANSKKSPTSKISQLLPSKNINKNGHLIDKLINKIMDNETDNKNSIYFHLINSNKNAPKHEDIQEKILEMKFSPKRKSSPNVKKLKLISKKLVDHTNDFSPKDIYYHGSNSVDLFKGIEKSDTMHPSINDLTSIQRQELQNNSDITTGVDDLPETRKLFKNSQKSFFKYNDHHVLGNAFMKSDPNYGQHIKEDLKDSQPILVRVGIHSHIIQPSYMQESGSMCFTELWSKKNKANYYHNINKSQTKIVRIDDHLRNPLREIDGIFKPDKISKVVHVIGKIQELNCGYDHTKKKAEERDIKRPPIIRYNPEQDYRKVKNLLDKKEGILDLSLGFKQTKASDSDIFIKSIKNSPGNSITHSPDLSRNGSISYCKSNHKLTLMVSNNDEKKAKKPLGNVKTSKLPFFKSNFINEKKNSYKAAEAYHSPDRIDSIKLTKTECNTEEGVDMGENKKYITFDSPKNNRCLTLSDSNSPSVRNYGLEITKSKTPKLPTINLSRNNMGLSSPSHAKLDKNEILGENVHPHTIIENNRDEEYSMILDQQPIESGLKKPIFNYDLSKFNRVINQSTESPRAQVKDEGKIIKFNSTKQIRLNSRKTEPTTLFSYDTHQEETLSRTDDAWQKDELTKLSVAKDELEEKIIQYRKGKNKHKVDKIISNQNH